MKFIVHSSRRQVFFLLFLLFVVLNSLSVLAGTETVGPPFYSAESEKWADSVLKRLTPTEKIGQLLMISAWSNGDSNQVNEILKQIRELHIGGLIFFQGGPIRQAQLNNLYQSVSRVPLFISIDGEWGLAMRLDSTIRFPRQMTLAAGPDDSVIYSMGVEIGKECRRMGIHINFAPVADVNDNPLNPVIGSRSFGDERESVYRKSSLYMKGLQDQHVLANAKHFPGHGNADTDSHFVLPLIKQSRQELEAIELFPFRGLIRDGLGSIMVAHLSIPSLDSTVNLPSTLSKPIVSGLLKEDMGFKGLVFTDAMNMKGVTSSYKSGIPDKLALLAGSDILLCSEDPRKAVDEIMISISNGEITQMEIDRRVKKILMAKFWCGLNETQVIDTNNIYRDLSSDSAISLQHRLYENSITVIKDSLHLLPLHGLDSIRVASVVVGDKKNNDFQQQLKLYANIDCYSVDKDAPVSIFEAFFNFLSNYDVIILSLHGTTMKAQTEYGIPGVAKQFIDSIIGTYKTIFVDFGNSYTLTRFSNLSKAAALMIAYEDFALTQQMAAQVIMGGSVARGRLPVSSGDYSRKSGIDCGNIIRFKYTDPGDAGVQGDKLNRIDSLVNSAMLLHAFPGCQVLVAKDEKVIYSKSFGNHTYENNSPVVNSDLYDVASITKITSTALAAMKLYEQGKINLDAPMSKYLPALKSTNKKKITIREVMAHQAGLQAWSPFWKQTIDSANYPGKNYSPVSSDEFNVRVADSLFIRNEFVDSVMKWIYNSPLGERGKYVYSDFGPILMKQLIEKVSKMPLEKFLEINFYTPLQLSNSAFLPRNEFPIDRIIPSTEEKDFRRQIVIGDVNDPTAALLGGISGNAGLFSNANDLAIIMQMLLNKGTYGGRTLLKPSTIDEFTRQQFPQNHNRRGLFFDKPEMETGKISPCAKGASALTFGHQGFTGTCVWADPQYNLVFVFLSNRTFPDTKNDKLVKMNIRTEIQQMIYDAIKVK